MTDMKIYKSGAVPKTVKVTPVEKKQDSRYGSSIPKPESKKQEKKHG
jgi:hypothetical protein